MVAPAELLILVYAQLAGMVPIVQQVYNHNMYVAL